MSKKTALQRLLQTKQPYVLYTSSNGGESYSAVGYTSEFEDEKAIWKEHDLGSDFSLDAAREVAAEWKSQFVGVYPID